MTVSMITCPSCRTMLFSDTIVCPACRHIMDEERAALLDDDDLRSRSEQIPCRSCGEANQIGLVRCWKCSAFLREDIQEAYYKMLRGEREVIYSQPADRQDTESQNEDSSDASDSEGMDEDDFELSGDYSLAGPSSAPIDEDTPSGTYNLREPDPRAASSNGSESHNPPATKSPEEVETATGQNDAETEVARTSRPSNEEEAPDREDHSVATGGDVLLDIALREEEEAEKQRKKREAKLQARQKKKGAQGSKDSATPSPERLAAQKKALARQKAAQRRAAARKRKAQQKYGTWLTDLHQHSIDPQKLKLKPGSVEKQFELVDVGCSAEGLIVVHLEKKPAFTLFRKPKSEPQEARKQVREHLEADKAKKDLPAASHQFFEKETLDRLKVVQPVVYVHESMFAGVPIFGEGRIAVRLPQLSGDVKKQTFLSFRLTDFRKFSKAFEKCFEIKDLGHLDGVPLTDPILDLECHYSDEPIQVIDPEAVKFYEADPEFKLELAGRRCENCGLVISEDARRKEKIGGLNGKSIAKAKCPKCEKKFGSISLFRLAGEKKKATEETPAGVK